MEGVYYAIFGIGILLIIVWCRVNDGLKGGKPMTGLFAIREPTKKEKARAAKSLSKRTPPKRWKLPDIDK